MNKFTKMAIVAAGVALVAQGARASFTVNDLYLGFTQGSASSDLIIDLGQGSSMSGSSVINLSGDLGGLSTFNTIFNNSANGVSMAIVGGDNVFNQYGVFATQLRTGGAGNASVAGSDLTGQTHISGQMSGGAGSITPVAALAGGLPAAGGMVTDPNKTYSSDIDLTTGANSFVGKTGVSPASTIDSSGVIMEDLWGATTSTAYSYKGYFTFDYNNDSLTFTPSTLAAVPEPATYGLFAGFGLLALSLRRQFRRKTA